MEVLAPLAMELPAPDAPVVVPAAAPVTGVADLTDPAGAGAIAEMATAAAVAVQEEAPQAVERAAPVAAVVVDSGSGGDRLVADDESGAGTVAATQTAAESTGASAVAPSPVVSVMATSSVEGAELTFTPVGRRPLRRDRHAVDGGDHHHDHHNR